MAEEHINVSAHSKRYHEDETGPPYSDLEIFQWNGKTVGPPVAYEFSEEERKSALLYMWTNIVDVQDLFR